MKAIDPKKFELPVQAAIGRRYGWRTTYASPSFNSGSIFGFEVPAGIDDLCGGGLRRHNAVVEQAPRCRGEARSNRGLVAGWEVSLDREHIEQDLVRLGKDFDDPGDLHSPALVVNALGPVSVGQCACSENSHWG